MSRYLFYFFYWYSPDEELKIALDFDSSQKAIEMLSEVQVEISYHIGEQFGMESTNIQLIEPYGLRPFSEEVWNQQLDYFVSKYGNEFAIIDLNQPTMGLIEHIRKNTPIGSIRPRNIVETTVLSKEWNNRTKLELRLITSLVRWLQFTQKRNWLHIFPDEIEKYQHKVWQIETVIPDSDSYTATWKVILPKNYPNKSPKLFIKSRDHWIVREIDKKRVWIDSKNDLFYYVSNINEETSGWTNTLFLSDWLLSGFWNFLARELKETFINIKFYKENVGLKNFSSLFPGELIDRESDEFKTIIQRTTRFLTWYCQRIPEKTNSTLQKIRESIPTSEVYSKLEWSDFLQNVDCTSLELFFEEIKIYYLEYQKDLTSQDIILLQESLKKCIKSTIGADLKKFIDELTKGKVRTVKILNIEEV